MKVWFLLSVMLVFVCTVALSQQKKGFTWREVVRVEDIPDAPVIGMLHGAEFNPKFARVKERKQHPEMLELEICQGKPKKPCGVYSGNKYRLTFPRDIESKTWDMSSEGKGTAGYNYVSGEEGQKSYGTTMWAGGIVIESRVGGKVRGKIALCFKEREGFKNWIAGRFEAVDCREKKSSE
jgi:hypothetical protein